MDRTALDNVFHQIGYCGIWCGSCAVGASALMEMARSYKGLCEAHGLGHWGADGFDYAGFLGALDAISELPGCPGCLQGGGRTDCEMRSCATARQLRGCAFCPETGMCEHTSVLEQMRDGARKADLLVADSPEAYDHLSEARRREHLASLWWWRALFGAEE